VQHNLVVRVRPFLRWAGGKQKVVKELLRFCPPSTSYGKYFEPFLGGGSLFFALEPGDAVLSDTNADLINCYRQIRRRAKHVAGLLDEHRSRDSREYFYRVRSLVQKQMSTAERAALFIYLNKAAFNGIYRVNGSGVFNVPYGPSHRGIALPSYEQLEANAEVLKTATLHTTDFESCIAQACSGDFVYLDPPYPPRSETAFFSHYTAERFGWEHQLRLARAFGEATDRGCLVMMSNADQKAVRALYASYNVSCLQTVRWLGSNGDRFGVRELVVTNY
jgi:DNA adenine methylase